MKSPINTDIRTVPSFSKIKLTKASKKLGSASGEYGKGAGRIGPIRKSGGDHAIPPYILFAFVVVGILGIVEGIYLASLLPAKQLPLGLRILVLVAVLVILFAFGGWALNRITFLERRRADMRQGAAGEILVGSILADLPDDFYVINDLPTSTGNLDHIVVGPTGVFVLETKNWRGIVSADGKGELLLNGLPTDKPFVRLFTARMMAVREKVRALAPGPDIYFNGIFVFTAARVEAKWGTTANVHCIRDDQLQSYVIDKKSREPLKEADATRIAQALQLAASS